MSRSPASEARTCSACGEGRIVPRQCTQRVQHAGVQETIPLHYAFCDVCGSEVADASQAKANKRSVSLQRDLLAQAHQLARHEPKRPNQASLRRAVSTGYYAVFHLLVDAASREIVNGPGQDILRQIFLLSLMFHGRWRR